MLANPAEQRRRDTGGDLQLEPWSEPECHDAGDKCVLGGMCQVTGVRSLRSRWHFRKLTRLAGWDPGGQWGWEGQSAMK